MSSAALAWDGVQQSQIESLQAAMKQQVDTMDTLVSEISLNSDHINSIQATMKKIVPLVLSSAKALTESNINTNLLSVIVNMYSYDAQVSFFLLSLENQLNKLSIHRLSPTFVSHETLRNNWNSIKAKAKRHNLELFSTDPNSLLTYKANLFILGGIPKIVINIPIKSSDTALNLFRYRNYPFQWGKLRVTIRNTQPYLLIDNKNMLFKTISQRDFDSCTKIPKQQFYACQFENVFSKDVKKSCLPKLFIGSMQHLGRYCDFVLDISKEMVSQVTSSTFKVQPLAPILTIDIRCNNITQSQQITINRTEVITVPPHCTGLSHDHIFKSTRTFATSGTIAPKIIYFRPEDVFGFTGVSEEELQRMHDLVADLKAESPLKKIDIDHFKAEYNRKKQKILSYLFQYRIELFFLIAVALVFAFSLMYCWWRRGCNFGWFRRGRRGGDDSEEDDDGSPPDSPDSPRRRPRHFKKGRKKTDFEWSKYSSERNPFNPGYTSRNTYSEPKSTGASAPSRRPSPVNDPRSASSPRNQQS